MALFLDVGDGVPKPWTTPINSCPVHHPLSNHVTTLLSLSTSSTPTALSSPPIPWRVRSASSMSCSRNPCLASMQTLVEATRKPSSLYELLRVKQTASPMEIKTTHRSLAKMYHLDASPVDSDGRDFIQIHNAYETLSDPATRAVYDLSLGSGDGGRMRTRLRPGGPGSEWALSDPEMGN